MRQDPVVQSIVERFEGWVVEQSIRPAETGRRSAVGQQYGPRDEKGQADARADAEGPGINRQGGSDRRIRRRAGESHHERSTRRQKGRDRSFLAVRSFFFQAEDGIRDLYVTGVQTCALPI